MPELQGENIGNTLQDRGVGKNSLTRTPFAWELKPMIDKVDLIKLKIFSTANEIKESHRVVIFASYTSIQNIFKKTLEAERVGKPNNPILQMASGSKQ